MRGAFAGLLSQRFAGERRSLAAVLAVDNDLRIPSRLDLGRLPGVEKNAPLIEA